MGKTAKNSKLKAKGKGGNGTKVRNPIKIQAVKSEIHTTVDPGDGKLHTRASIKHPDVRNVKKKDD